MGPIEQKLSNLMLSTLLTMFIGLGVWVLAVAWYSAVVS